MATLETTVRAYEAGERRWFWRGGVHTWLATEDETGGAYLLFEDALDAGKVTPAHQHPEADETFYMIEGEVRLHIAGDEQTLAAGGIAIIPARRTPCVHGDDADGTDALSPDAGRRGGVLPARERAGRRR
jgi:mannose-6-phosphate isomerase-like protein (cupin superfamily)